MASVPEESAWPSTRTAASGEESTSLAVRASTALARPVSVALFTANSTSEERLTCRSVPSSAVSSDLSSDSDGTEIRRVTGVTGWASGSGKSPAGGSSLIGTSSMGGPAGVTTVAVAGLPDGAGSTAYTVIDSPGSMK